MSTTSIDFTAGVHRQLADLRRACRQLVILSEKDINDTLYRLADLIPEKAGLILKANARDLARMDPADSKYDRLLLNEARLNAIADDIRKVASLPAPLGKNLEERTLPNGLQLEKVSVPMGVTGIVYESRPNVTFDVFALCFKSGNAAALKGSRDAHDSNTAIISVIQEALAPLQLESAVALLPSDREALLPLLQAVGQVDVIIPRGSQGLINFVRNNAKVPVIETGAGIVHTYFDASGDLQKGAAIIENAKSRRVSVCNALDTLLLHRSRLSDLPALMQNLGQIHQCEVFADAEAYAALYGYYPGHLLHIAQAEHFGTEFLSMKCSIKTVGNLEEALDHIDNYSSKHSEAIVAEDITAQQHFLKRVDAAVVYANVSTAFTDGAQFGMGAEIGISTQKLHARGPMALPELCSYKWMVRGNGQIRK